MRLRVKTRESLHLTPLGKQFHYLRIDWWFLRRNETPLVKVRKELWSDFIIIYREFFYCLHNVVIVFVALV